MSLRAVPGGQLQPIELLSVPTGQSSGTSVAKLRWRYSHSSVHNLELDCVG